MSKIEVEASALDSLKAMCERLQQERDELLVYLRDARDSIADWGAYASDYFQEKHGLQDELDNIDAFIAKCTQEQ